MAAAIDYQMADDNNDPTGGWLGVGLSAFSGIYSTITGKQPVKTSPTLTAAGAAQQAKQQQQTQLLTIVIVVAAAYFLFRRG